jgi:hypothetical protein
MVVLLNGYQKRALSLHNSKQLSLLPIVFEAEDEGSCSSAASTVKASNVRVYIDTTHVVLRFCSQRSMTNPINFETVTKMDTI